MPTPWEKIVLANPSLRITLESEKGVVLEHAGGDLRDAIASVYPNLDISRFIAVDRTASSGVRVTGYISEVGLYLAHALTSDRHRQRKSCKLRHSFCCRGQGVCGLSRQAHISDVRAGRRRPVRGSGRQRASRQVRSAFPQQKTRYSARFSGLWTKR